MRISFLKRVSFTLSLLACLVVSATAQSAARGGDASNMLPDKIGDFNAQGAPVKSPKGMFESISREDYGVTSDARRLYTSADGKSFDVHLVQTTSDAAAYSLFTRRSMSASSPVVKLGDAGTVSVSAPKEILFSKGRAFVNMNDLSSGQADPQALADFARAFAGTIEGGENGLPVLVSHLPDWEKTYERAGYAVSLPALQQAAGNRPVLDAISFDGDAEAVTSNYGESRLVIIEFTTPQHAFDADAAINQRIAELRAAGQPAPSSYKRIGNYSVFVFDAPDAVAADKLVSSVKYEKDVRWLGRNPHAEEIATRAYTTKMGGVILTTLIATGLAILLCLGVGGVIGGAVFLHRRARHAAQEIYTDAGGMVRLNIEELNTPPASANLLGRGEE
ncbi:MAG: hypothetical protein QOE46_952 [Acidobacteriota bacterium]|nr:hypothetical protein [Acidobacteriota bacterium]